MTKVNFKTLWSLRVTKCYLYNTSGPHDPSINLWDIWIAVLSSRSLKHQKCMFPGWWRPEVHNKGISRVTVPLRLWVEFFLSLLNLIVGVNPRCSTVTVMPWQSFPQPYRMSSLWVCCTEKCSYLNQLHLQQPCFQVGALAEVLLLMASTYLYRETHSMPSNIHLLKNV